MIIMVKGHIAWYWMMIVWNAFICCVNTWMRFLLLMLPKTRVKTTLAAHLACCSERRVYQKHRRLWSRNLLFPSCGQRRWHTYLAFIAFHFDTNQQIRIEMSYNLGDLRAIDIVQYLTKAS